MNNRNSKLYHAPKSMVVEILTTYARNMNTTNSSPEFVEALDNHTKLICQNFVHDIGDAEFVGIDLIGFENNISDKIEWLDRAHAAAYGYQAV